VLENGGIFEAQRRSQCIIGKTNPDQEVIGMQNGTGESWRIRIREWADAVAKSYAEDAGILGVMIGGSIARGQEWEHSDLEMGILVESRRDDIPYFNVQGDRGVEILQLEYRDLCRQIENIEKGDLSEVVKWPIQLWEGVLLKDTTGTLKKFKDLFDKNLFSGETLEFQIKAIRKNIESDVGKTNESLKGKKYIASMITLREAMNEAVLYFYWKNGELPRSQNRTESRLKERSLRYGDKAIHPLFMSVFELEDGERIVKELYPKVKEKILGFTKNWGDSATEFFVHAVDSDFSWGENLGILYVYRLYVPIIGEFHKFADDEAWQRENREVLEFLGLDAISERKIVEYRDRILGYIDL
jgi:hypothetical protein